jgi:aminopeptidase YwaD
MNYPFRSFTFFVPLLYFQLFSCFLSAQQKEHGDVYRYGRQIVDTLASPSMHGRGYVNDGDKIAARYLEKELRGFGLKYFNTTYRQEFHLSVNTFPDKGTTIYDRGEEFVQEFPEGVKALVNCDSPPRQENEKRGFQMVWLDSSTLSSAKQLKKFQKTKFQNKALVIDPFGISDKTQLALIEAMKQNPVHAEVLIVFNNKRLMWEVAQHTADFASFELLVKDSLHKKTHNDLKKAGKIHYAVHSKFISDYQTQNLIGYIPGTVYPDSFIVFSAHYDHLGQLGPDTYFPGANDNASGCAMLLNMVNYYSMPEHKPKCSIAFMLFGAEEAGLVGSKYYTEHPLFPLKQIKFLINLDIMGTGDEGITVVNGTSFPDQFKMLQQINDKNHFLPEVKIRGQTHNSDHYFFSEHGVKAFFIYTRGGIKAYHDIYDKAETLPLSRFEDVFHLLTSFEEWLDNPTRL